MSWGGGAHSRQSCGLVRVGIFPPVYRNHSKGNGPHVRRLCATPKGTTSITTHNDVGDPGSGPKSSDVSRKLTLLCRVGVRNSLTLDWLQFLLVQLKNPHGLAIGLDWIACLLDPLRYPLFLGCLWRIRSRAFASAQLEYKSKFHAYPLHVGLTKFKLVECIARDYRMIIQGPDTWKRQVRLGIPHAAMSSTME